MSAVLFIIDHQIGDLGNFSALEKMALDSHIQSASKVLKQREIPSVHVAYSGPDVDFEPMPEGVGLFKDTPKENTTFMMHHKGLRFCRSLPRNALVAYKNSNSLQNEPSINRWIRANNIADVIVCGVFEVKPHNEHHTHACCVSQTAIDFALMGLNVTIVAEATNNYVRDKGRKIPLALRREVHERHGVRVDPIDDISARYDASGLRPGAANAEMPLGGLGF